MASTTRPTIAAARNRPKRRARRFEASTSALLRLGQADALGNQGPRLGERLAPLQQEVATPALPLPGPHRGRQAGMRAQVFAILLAPGPHARPMLEQGLVRNRNDRLPAIVEVADEEPRLEQCLDATPGPAHS